MLIIGLCIGFIVGNISGVVLMGLLIISSNDDKRREQEDEQIYENFSK